MWYEINVTLNGRHFFATQLRAVKSNAVWNRARESGLARLTARREDSRLDGDGFHAGRRGQGLMVFAVEDHVGEIEKLDDIGVLAARGPCRERSHDLDRDDDEVLHDGHRVMSMISISTNGNPGPRSSDSRMLTRRASAPFSTRALDEKSWLGCPRRSDSIMTHLR